MSNQDIISGGPIPYLEKGWAKFPFQGEKAHYWIEDRDTMPAKIGAQGRNRYYKSACGKHGAVNDRIPALDAGNWGRCKNCQRKSKI